MYQAEANDPRDDYAGAGIPADVAEFLSPFSRSYDARRSLGDAGSGGGMGDGSGGGLGIFAAEDGTDAIAIADDDTPEGLGWIQFIPAIATGVREVWNAVDGAGGGDGEGANPLEAITDKVPPSAINAFVGPDGYWYDNTTRNRLSHEEASRRQHAYMAALIGATVQADGYWRRNGQVLTHAQAYQLYQQITSGTANTGTPNPPVNATGNPSPSYPVTYTPAPPPTPTYPVNYPGPQYPGAPVGTPGAAPRDTTGYADLARRNMPLIVGGVLAIVLLPRLLKGRA